MNLLIKIGVYLVNYRLAPLLKHSVKNKYCVNINFIPLQHAILHYLPTRYIDYGIPMALNIFY